MLLEDMAAKTLYPLQFFCLQTVFSGQEDLGCQKMFLLLIQVEVQEEGEEMAAPVLPSTSRYIWTIPNLGFSVLGSAMIEPLRKFEK